MKKLVCFALAALLSLGGLALAEDLEDLTKEELIEMVEQLQAENAQYREQLGIEDEEETNDGTAEESDAETAEDAEGYVDLEKGSSGDEVKALQQRLIELGYLSGSADGIYGSQTEAAVSSFQSQHSMTVTGAADAATQEMLFSDAAQEAIVYGELEYTNVSRNPDDYEGQYVKFNGTVLQVIEEDTLVGMRIATSGSYNDVVFVIMTIPEDYSRILEDDDVTVYGQYAGLYSYESVLGSTITIPLVSASLVSLR